MTMNMEPLLFAGLVATLCLLCGALALIDYRRGIIPDGLNLAIAAVGLVKVMLVGGTADGLAAAAEAIVVGAVFWLFRRLYFALRRIQGLGLGDVKFLAASTLWVGTAGIPVLLLVAALSALLVLGGAQLAGQSLTRQTSLPFGPFLAVGLLAAVAGQEWFGLI
jgi:leader peptidase (prepilin peptidase) / N-methyltransferase